MIAAYPVPGKRCWASFCGSYGLPPGLPNRTPLKIVEWFEFTGKCRDDHGVIWELLRVQIDTGFILYLDGQECHESHPKAAAYFRHSAKALSEILKISPDGWVRPVSRFQYESDLSKLRWYLARNGYDPDAPLPSGPPPRLSGAPKQQPASNPRLPQRNDPNGPRRMNS